MDVNVCQLVSLLNRHNCSNVVWPALLFTVLSFLCKYLLLKNHSELGAADAIFAANKVSRLPSNSNPFC